MHKTKNCPNCNGNAADAIVLGDADPREEGLLECGCGAVFTEKAQHDGHASAYYHPRLGINLFRSVGSARYMSVPGASLL